MKKKIERAILAEPLNCKPISRGECYKEFFGFVEIMLERPLSDTERDVALSLLEVAEARRRFPFHFEEEARV